jgi:DNA-binding CsgD family transcriptional regulator
MSVCAEVHPASALDGCGAVRYRDAAQRALRQLGQRIHRRTRPGDSDSGVSALTGRELEIAELIVDRKTNAEIARELFLSKKTVETHIRNMFRKLHANSRVDIARRWKPPGAERVEPRCSAAAAQPTPVSSTRARARCSTGDGDACAKRVVPAGCQPPRRRWCASAKRFGAASTLQARVRSPSSGPECIGPADNAGHV